MEVLGGVEIAAETTLKTIEMHTTGEPTRIVYSGFPDLQSKTLLDQRAEARSRHDHIRRALICEPRGHREMYGAVLRPRTELVDSGEADIGVLFITNDGYSTMCGHATLALGRLLVDVTGSPPTGAFPRLDPLRDRLKKEVLPAREEVTIRLHVPCGLVQVSVPVVRAEADPSTWKCDPSRSISYLSVPSFAAGINVSISIPQVLKWPELGDRSEVSVDIAYGGTFYLIARPAALGFHSERPLAMPHFAALSFATKQLKIAFNSSHDLRTKYLHHSDSPDLQFLYATILVADSENMVDGTGGAETGLCFFANQQVDRSPTGSGVQARVALAHAKGERRIGQFWTYQSLVSDAQDGEGAFVGGAVSTGQLEDIDSVIVKVSGFAKYTGSCSFIIEENDPIGKGFWFDEQDI